MAAMLRVLLLVLCLFAIPLAATEQGYRSFSPGRAPGGLFSFLDNRQRIDAFFFRSADTRLVVLDEGDGGKRYGSLDAALRAEHCIAGINGGYFAADAARTPLGLLRHRGQQVTPLASGSFAVAGVLYDTGRELRLERSKRLTVGISRMQEAIQGGPFLVEHGKKVSGLNATRRARRSFVATDGRGNWCLAMSSPLTLDELAAALASGKALGSFRVQAALNMDGGTSSAFRVMSPGVHKPGVKAVRNYLGLLPRSGLRKGNTAAPDNKRPATQRATRASRQ